MFELLDLNIFSGYSSIVWLLLFMKLIGPSDFLQIYIKQMSASRLFIHTWQLTFSFIIKVCYNFKIYFWANIYIYIYIYIYVFSKLLKLSAKSQSSFIFWISLFFLPRISFIYTILRKSIWKPFVVLIFLFFIFFIWLKK